MYGIRGQAIVLIESDWNLKDTADGTYTGWYNVLIESDWNLK